MTRIGAAALAGVLALIALNACGSAEQPGRGSASSPTPTTTVGPTEVRIVPPNSTGGKQSRVRVKGTVSEGVEPGCIVLTTKGVSYVLISRQGTLVTGQEVEVEGTVRPDLRTTCQQGTPLVVERVLQP